MNTKLPRIASAHAPGGADAATLLVVSWRGGATERVELAGWIATGGDTLTPLRDPAVFATAEIDEYGSAVIWGGEDGDLAIDAHHLEQIAEQQRPFGEEQVAIWQGQMGLSNQEAAEFLGVSLSTWNAYKATGLVPPQIRMLCRAALRDPILMQAHYRPRKAGRPRKSG